MRSIFLSFLCLSFSALSFAQADINSAPASVESTADESMRTDSNPLTKKKFRRVTTTTVTTPNEGMRASNLNTRAQGGNVATRKPVRRAMKKNRASARHVDTAAVRSAAAKRNRGQTVTTTTEEMIEETPSPAPVRETQPVVVVTPPPAPVAPPAPAPVAPPAGVTAGNSEDDAKSGRVGGLFLEPYLSVGQDSTSFEGAAAGVDNQGITQKLTGGARIGIHASRIFFGGLDGRYSYARLEDTFYGASDGHMINVGPLLGLQFPRFGLRAWGSYVLLGTYNPDAGAQGYDVDFSDPRGYRVGAGYRFHAVSLNVEYENLSWKNSSIESTGSSGIAANDVDLNNEGFNVSLSFPIEL